MIFSLAVLGMAALTRGGEQRTVSQWLIGHGDTNQGRRTKDIVSLAVLGMAALTKGGDQRIGSHQRCGHGDAS